MHSLLFILNKNFYKLDYKSNFLYKTSGLKFDLELIIVYLTCDNQNWTLIKKKGFVYFREINGTVFFRFLRFF